jgi:hypothetical protein
MLYTLFLSNKFYELYLQIRVHIGVIKYVTSVAIKLVSKPLKEGGYYIHHLF